MKILDAASGDVLQTLRGHRASVQVLAFSPDGRRLASGGRGGRLIVWNLVAKTRSLYDTGATSFLHLHFFSDGENVAAVDGSRVFLWNVSTGVHGPVRVLENGARAVTSTASDELIVATGDGAVEIVDLAGEGDPASFARADGDVSLACSPGGRLVGIGTASGEIHLWRLDPPLELARLNAHAGAVTCLSFGPEGSRLASGGTDRIVKLWGLSYPARTRNPRARISILPT